MSAPGPSPRRPSANPGRTGVGAGSAGGGRNRNLLAMNDTAPLPTSTPADSSAPTEGASSAGSATEPPAAPPDEAPTTPPTGPSTAPPLTASAPLVRPRDGRMIGGVCASLAEHFGVDVLLVRVLAVVLAVSGGAGVAAYLAFWLLTPS